jgi:hypothetical protein
VRGTAGGWWPGAGGWWFVIVICGLCANLRASDTLPSLGLRFVHQPPTTSHKSPITSHQPSTVDWVSPAPDSLAQPPAPLVPTPAVVHGLYVNRWAAIGTKVWQSIHLAEQTGINALVIDVKDDRGFVLYRSRVALAHAIGADTVRPLGADRVRALLDTLRLHHIYPIARIVVAKDPLLAERRPAWAIRSRRDSSLAWHDSQGRPWVDANQRGVWQYAVDLAREAIDHGFSEVQFDYVRFPDDKNLVREAMFPLAHGRTRAQVIREQLGFVYAALASDTVPVSADVFGLTASDTTDMGIGQRWEMFVDQVDIVSPMSYPSHYAPGTYHLQNPNAHPYAVIDHTLKDAARRSAGIPHAANLRPWYQDFTLGPPRYGPGEVRAQIQAGYDNGIRSWLLWNPGSRYGSAELVLPSPASTGR